MRFIKRTLSAIIQKAQQENISIIISGISGCGKSMCILSVCEKAPLIPMSNLKNIILAGNNGNDFFKKYGTRLIIDNIEEEYNLLKYIKDDYNLILISDSKINIKYKQYINHFNKYILHGFSIYELANMGHMQKPYIPQEKQPCIISHKSISYTYQLIWKGFLPEIALIEDNKEWDKAVSQKIESIIKNGIMGQINIANKLMFLNFLKELVHYIGRELNLLELAKKTNMAPNTIKSWIEILENINFIYLLPAYHIKNKRRYIKTPKLYMEDTGIASWLLNIETPSMLEEYEHKDKIFENFVVLEIIKSYHHNGLPCKLYHYRDNLNVKIDLLLEDDKYLYPINISNKQNIDANMVSSFEKAVTDKEIGYGNLICLSDKSITLNSKAKAFSIWEI